MAIPRSRCAQILEGLQRLRRALNIELSEFHFLSFSIDDRHNVMINFSTIGEVYITESVSIPPGSALIILEEKPQKCLLINSEGGSMFYYGRERDARTHDSDESTFAEDINRLIWHRAKSLEYPAR